MRKSILKSIAQVVLIVFSVVLGLFLSERIEDRKNEKAAARLLSKIKSELNDNKKLLDIWVPYHEEMVKSLDSVSNDETFINHFIEDPTTLYRVFTKGTIMGETPASDAWDIAKSHPLIVNFGYDELFIISKVYKQQEASYSPFPKMVEPLLSPDLNARDKAKSNLLLLKNQLQDIVSRERQLIYYYNKAEDVLKYQNE